MNYVTSVALWGLTTDEMVEAVAREQMDGIIWSYEQLKQLNERPERMKRQHESSSLRFALDGPSDLNLCAVNETIRRHSMKEAKRAIEWARTLGVDWLRFDAGNESMTPALRQWQRRTMQQAVYELDVAASRAGVVIAFGLQLPSPDALFARAERLNGLVKHCSPHVVTIANGSNDESRRLERVIGTEVGERTERGDVRGDALFYGTWEACQKGAWPLMPNG